jgi:hypothetical protein
VAGALSSCLSTWEHELKGDEDELFLINGIKNGFSIVDEPTVTPEPVCIENSNTSPAVKTAITNKLIEGINEGHYKVVAKQPTIVSGLHAVPKPDGDIRLIHDCSRPEGHSVNDYATKDECSYQSVQELLDGIRPNWHIAKVDLKSAYKSAELNKNNYEYTGIKWQFPDSQTPTFLVDTRLPFGARKSPAIFNRITQAVKRMMFRRGFTVVIVYLDDFVVAAETFEQCLEAFNALIALLRSLGFQINWKKVVDPCTKLTFLGVLVDSVAGIISLDPPKLASLVTTLQGFCKRKRATRRNLESLAGKLSWAANVFVWARLHIRSIFDLIACLQLPHHKCRLASIKTDLCWWLNQLCTSSNCKSIWNDRPVTSLYTDACVAGGGAFCRGDWTYIAWHLDLPHLKHTHINIKELAMVVAAAHRWGALWSGQHILLYIDNMAALGMINKGTTPCTEALELLRELGALAMSHDFSIEAIYIASEDNVIADAISRFHVATYITVFVNSVSQHVRHVPMLYWLPNHMSSDAVIFLSSQIIERWKTWNANLMRRLDNGAVLYGRPQHVLPINRT